MGCSTRKSLFNTISAAFNLAIGFALLIPSTSFANSGVTYHGRLLKPDGTPVLATTVQFRLQIRTPGTEDCLLYQEQQTQNLSTTNGMFAISLADGNGTRQDTNAWNLFDAFSNRKSFTFNGADCVGGTTYAPNPTDNREFKVSFNDGTFAGWEDLPVQNINFIPMSIETYAVGGYPASSLLRVETAGNLGTAAPITSTQLTELLALLNGSSTQYSSPNELNGSVLPTIGTGQSVRWTGTAWEAYTPPTNASLPTCTAGQVLTSNGTALSCVAGGGGAVDGDDITSGTIGGTTAWNTSGNITTTGTITATGAITGGSISGSTVSTRDVRVYEATNTNYVSIQAPAGLTPNYTLTLPPNDGGTGQVLSTNGSGVLSWITPATGTVGLADIRSTVNSANQVFPSSACTTAETLRYNGLTGMYECSAVSVSGTSVTGAILDGGNTTGATVVVGTNDGRSLQLETNNLPRLTILNDGKVGIGNATPSEALSVTGKITATNAVDAFMFNAISGGPFTPLVSYNAAGGTDEKYWDFAHQATSFSLRASNDAYGASTNAITFNRSGFSISSTVIPAGSLGVGTTSPATRLDVAGTIKIANGGEACSAAGNGGMLRYSGTSLQYCNGSAWQTLGVSGAGLTNLNGQTGSSQTFAITHTGNASSFTSASDVHTVNIPMASTAAVTAGLISKTDYDTFAGKQNALGFTPLNPANNLNDLANAGTARTNLGLGTSATLNTGTTNGTVPLIGAGDKLPASIIPDIAGGSITNTPAGNIAATTAQAAINELDTEKVAKAGDTMTGTLNLPSDGLVVGTNQLTVTGGGDVGIGTASPFADVDLYRNTRAIMALRGTSFPAASAAELLMGEGSTRGYFLASKGANYVGEENRFVISYTHNMTNFHKYLSLLPNTATDSSAGDATFHGRLGVGTDAPAVSLHVAGTIKVADGGETCSAAANGGMIRYSGTSLQYCNGSSWQTLGVSGSGLTNLNGQTGSSQTFAITHTGNASSFTSASNVHTVNIPMASTAAVTAGLISKTDYDTFNAKIGAVAGSPLNSGQMWVGAAGNVAAAVTMSGDGTISNTGGLTVTRIQGNPVLAGTPTDGQVLRYHGTNNRYETGHLTVSDIRSAANMGISVFPTSCTASQTMTWSALTDTFVCSAFANTAAGNIAATTTQAAINELDTEKVAKAGDTMTGALTMNAQNEVRFADSDSSNYVGLRSPATVSTNRIWTLPAADGSSGQVLSTNGSGVLSWQNSAAGAGDLLNGGNAGAVVVGSNDNTLTLESNNTARMTILSDGKVGIGTTAPTTNLEMRGGTALTSNTLTIENPAGGDATLTLTSTEHTISMVASTDNGSGGPSINSGASTLAYLSGTHNFSDSTSSYNTTINSQGIQLSKSAANPIQDFEISAKDVNSDTTPAGLIIRGTDSASATNYPGGSITLKGGNSTGSGSSEIKFFTATAGSSGITTRTSTEKMVLNGAGYLGIGTTSPNRLLHVNGAMRMTASPLSGVATPGTGDMIIDSNDGNKLKWHNGTGWQTVGTGAGSGDVLLGGNSAGAAMTLGNNDNFALNLETNNTARMTILSGGNIGIGTTNPGAALHISETGAGAPKSLVVSNPTAAGWGVGSEIAFRGGASNAEMGGIENVWLGAATATEMSLKVVRSSSVATGVKIGGDVYSGTTAPRVAIGAEPAGSIPTRHLGVYTPTTWGDQSVNSLYLLHYDSDSAGTNGIGTEITLNAETSANGVFAEAATVKAILDDATSTSVDASLRFSTMGPNTNASGNATEKMRITSGGLVGIGTNDPARLLHVNGPMRVTASALPLTPGAGDMAIDSGDGNKLKWYNGTTWQTAGAASGAGDLLNGGNAGAVVVGSNDNSLTLESNNTARMTILSGGNIGIGTTNPTFGLDVHTGSARVLNASGDATLTVARTGSKAGLIGAGFHGAGFIFDDTGKFSIGPGTRANIDAGVYSGYDLLTILAGGQVGIGVDTPDVRLEVADGSAWYRGTPNTTAVFSSGNTGTTDAAIALGSINGDTPFIEATQLGNGSAPAGLALRVNASEKMRILDNGHVGIATTNPSEPLTVQSLVPDTGLLIQGNFNSNDSVNINLVRSRGTPAAPTALQAGDEIFNILSQGRAPAGGDAWTTGIMSFVDGNPSGGDVPALLQFWTNSGTGSWGPRMTIKAGGNVGIGEDNPSEKLQVIGNMKASGQIVSGSQTISSGTNSINWNNGNSILTDYDCGSTINMANLQDGGTYTLVVTGAGTAQCNFNTSVTGTGSGTVVYRWKPLNTTRTASSTTVYTFMRVGSVVLVSWSSGFQ